ncbi:hypothetical protein CLV86_2196 [Lacinutrix venerupis]|uniref:hypothetical protein n=1 Tax=Lacinutrix venerupis TaxID=1486034 RepID=UPI000EB5CE5E|nr:hypothetical protein [Lacinutrix venerupis]RLJ62588.1 hypothetical protein CLV86_2196 [Lacinutrix venerupis]
MSFAKLAPPKDFTVSFKNINRLSTNIQTFNKNIEMKAKINSLSGTAFNFAVDIRDNLVPKLKSIGLDLAACINIAEKEIKTFGENMVKICEALKVSNVDVNELKGALKTALAQSQLVQKIINEGITPDLDLYEQKLNGLISELSSEKLAIKDNDGVLKRHRNEILQKIKARTHTVSGVVETIWDAITFQLQDKLEKDERDLAQIQLQFNANSIAIGAASSMIGTLTSFDAEMDSQSRYWVVFSTLLHALDTDIKELLNTHDNDIESLYIELVESDWTAIKNAK